MIGIIKHRKIWFVFSGIVIAIAIAALGFWRIQLGTDFTGGSLLEVRWAGEAPTITELGATIDPVLARDFIIQPTDANGSIVRTEHLSEDQHQEVLKALLALHGDFDELRFDSIGPVIGQELARKSLWALIIVFASIVLYVAFVFRKVSHPVSSWKYGLLTVVTGLHDVLIPLGLFAILGYFFGTEVNAAFVAAVLTVLGYSINDTIVVFDRIRENLSKRGSDAFEDVVESSVNQTLARSLNTSITTLLVLLAVFLFGGATVRDFTLVLIVGIIAGAYSSIFIASPLLVAWHKKKKIEDRK
jgi:preprotein translocase subunit SecF